MLRASGIFPIKKLRKVLDAFLTANSSTLAVDVDIGTRTRQK